MRNPYETMVLNQRIRLMFTGPAIQDQFSMQINTSIRDVLQGLLAGKYHMSAICALNNLDSLRKHDPVLVSGLQGQWVEKLHVQLDLV